VGLAAQQAARGALIALGLGLAGFTTASGCGRSAEQREATSLLARLERMREADAAEREGLLATLEQQHPQGQTAERARTVCVSAYRALHESTRLEARVRRELSSPDPAPTSLADLQKAEDELARAKREMPECDGAIVALRQLVR
jgi:hypothetical protein